MIVSSTKTPMYNSDTLIQPTAQNIDLLIRFDGSRQNSEEKRQEKNHILSFWAEGEMIDHRRFENLFIK